mgnify:CR=1 FL=1
MHGKAFFEEFQVPKIRTKTGSFNYQAFVIELSETDEETH